MDLFGLFWTLFAEPYFSLGDVMLTFFIWIEVIPWVRRKWQEKRGYAWTCPYCKKKSIFRITIRDDKEIVSVIALDHIKKFHKEKT